MKGQLIINDDGTVGDKPSESDQLTDKLAATQADNRHMVDQLTTLGVDIAAVMTPQVMLGLRVKALETFVLGSVPDEMRAVFNLLFEDALGDTLQGVVAEASRPKLWQA